MKHGRKMNGIRIISDRAIPPCFIGGPFPRAPVITPNR